MDPVRAACCVLAVVIVVLCVSMGSWVVACCVSYKLLCFYWPSNSIDYIISTMFGRVRGEGVRVFCCIHGLARVWQCISFSSVDV